MKIKVCLLVVVSLMMLNCITIKKTPRSSKLLVIITKTDTSADTVDGQIIVTVSNGVEPYTYEWSHDPNESGNNIADLTSGHYTVTVSDSNGEKSISQIIIN